MQPSTERLRDVSTVGCWRMYAVLANFDGMALFCLLSFLGRDGDSLCRSFVT